MTFLFPPNRFYVGHGRRVTDGGHIVEYGRGIGHDARFSVRLPSLWHSDRTSEWLSNSIPPFIMYSGLCCWSVRFFFHCFRSRSYLLLPRLLAPGGFRVRPGKWASLGQGLRPRR